MLKSTRSQRLKLNDSSLQFYNGDSKCVILDGMGKFSGLTYQEGQLELKIYPMKFMRILSVGKV